SKIRDVRRLVAIAVGMAALLPWRSAEAQNEPLAPTHVDPSPFEIAGSDVQEPPGWRFDAALYMWLPGLFGTVQAHDRTADVDLTVDEVIDLVFDRWRALDGGGHFEAHYDRLDLFADVVGGYVKPGASATTERLGRPVRFDALLTAHFVFVEFGLAYRVLEWSVPDRRRP